MPRRYTFPDREEVNRKARIHHRIMKQFGKASDQICSDCDGPASDWSLIHGRDDEDVNNYEPRCRKCHMVYDGAGSNKCPPNCSCGRHLNNPPGRVCLPGCNCNRHRKIKECSCA